MIEAQVMPGARELEMGDVDWLVQIARMPELNSDQLFTCGAFDGRLSAIDVELLTFD